VFQRVRQAQRHLDVLRKPAVQSAAAVSTVGKRTLTQDLPLGAPNYYVHAIDSARRELRAVRTVALPAFIKALRADHADAITKRTQLLDATLRVRHLLLTANQHVKALEKAATFRDPNVLHLRHDLDMLASRATKLGIYRDAEDMLPRGHVEEKPRPPRGADALRVRKPSAAQQRATAIAKTARTAVPTWARTAPPSAVQRKAERAAYTRDVHATAARGVEGASAPLPFLSTIQKAFGRHDVSRVRVQIGGAGADAAQQLGAKAYATGDAIAFASAPDLHTAAHEAAHVIQQRRGISLSNNIDEIDDRYERHADAIADAVVSGRSVESMLDASEIGPSAMTVQRKTDDAPDVATTKHSFRHRTEFDFRIGVVPTKVFLDFDLSLKDKGTLKHGVLGRNGEVTYGNNQLLIVKSAEGLNAKITTSLLKANFDLLADGILPGELAALPISPKVEIKGLEGGLSIREGFSLKLMTLAVYVEGNFSSLFDESTRSFLDAKGVVRIECALDPELARKLIELAKATDAIRRSAAVEARIAKSEKWLAYWRKHGAKDKVKQLERELTRLRRVRESVSKARDVAVKKIQQIGASLEKTAAGRLIKKVGGKALAMVFKKFIPIYNIVSTAQDIYEAGKYSRI
jgi:hypothetical protein